MNEILESNKPTLIEDLGLMEYGSQGLKKRYGIFKCPKCNKPYKTVVSVVKSGKSSQCKSCHCRKKSTKHGYKGTRLYGIWQGMKTRCSNKNNEYYYMYGAIGIKVCKEWTYDFVNFKDRSLKNGYGDTLSIDRKDGTKGYSPDNCRWTTKFVQSQNTKLIRVNNNSGYRGVAKHSQNDSYVCKIQANGKSTYLGSFKTKEEAAMRYNEYVLKNNLQNTLNEIKGKTCKNN